MVKNLPARWKTLVWSLVLADPPEKGMATHSSMLARRIPRMEEPGGLQSTGLQSVGHSWATNSFTSICPKLRNGAPFCVWEGAGAWAHWHLSLTGASAVRGLWPVFSHPELPQGSPWRVAARQRAFFPSWAPSRLTTVHYRVAITDDCDTPVYWYGRKYSISQTQILISSF